MRADGNAGPVGGCARSPTVPVVIGRVPPAGFEPAPLPPEGSALSPELRGLVRVAGETLSARDGPHDAGPQGAGSGSAPRSFSMSAMRSDSAVWLCAMA